MSGLLAVAVLSLTPTAEAATSPLSADGRLRAFTALADGTYWQTAKLHDRESGVTGTPALTRGGDQAPARYLSMDWSGEVVAFSSPNRLAAADIDLGEDLYVRDRRCATTELVPTGNSPSHEPVLSGDGRYVAFSAVSSDLTPGTPPVFGGNVFVADRVTGAVEPVSVNQGGIPAGAIGGDFDLSADGRHVAFISHAQLSASDGDTENDVYVRDRVAGTTERIPHPAPRLDGGGPGHPSVSADGRFIAFSWHGSGVWLHDRRTGTARRVDAWPSGGGYARYPAVSADGSRVAFSGDPDPRWGRNGDTTWDVWVRDMDSGAMTRVDAQGDLPRPEISADGRWVSWLSWGNVSGAHDLGSARPVPRVTPAQVPCPAPGEGADYARLVDVDDAWSHWRLGEGDRSAVAADSSGPYPGAYELRDGRLGVPGALAGDPDGALELSGEAGNAVTVRRDLYGFPGRDGFTVEAWIRPRRLNAHTRRIISAESAPRGATNADAGYLLGIRADALVFSRYAAGRWSTVSAPPPPAGEWTHVAAAYDGTLMRLYVNGRVVGSKVSSISLPARPVTFTLGAKQGRWKFFAGGLDEVAVYVRAIPQARLQEHYWTGIGR